MGAVRRVDVDQDRADLRGGVLRERPLRAVRATRCRPGRPSRCPARDQPAASASTSRSSSAQVQRRPVANSTSASRSGYAATVALEVGPDRLLEQRRLGLALRVGLACAERTPGWSAVGRVGGVTSTDADPVESGEKQRPFKALRETVLLLAFAIVLALVVKTFFVQSFYIPSESMEPGLIVNDRILVQKPSYWGSGGPQRGDVIVFDDPGGWLNGLRAAQPMSPVGPRAGQDRALPDRRPPGEAGDRRRGRHRPVLRRPGPDHGQRAARSTRTTSSPQQDPPKSCDGPDAQRPMDCNWTAGPVPAGTSS